MSPLPNTTIPTLPEPSHASKLEALSDAAFEQAEIAAERARRAACVTRGTTEHAWHSGLDREAVALQAMYRARAKERAETGFLLLLTAGLTELVAPERFSPVLDLLDWWNRRNSATAADLRRAA